MFVSIEYQMIANKENELMVKQIDNGCQRDISLSSFG